MADPIATAADYADAIMTARRAKNTLFLLLLLILLAQLALFFLGRNDVVDIEGAGDGTATIELPNPAAATQPATSETTTARFQWYDVLEYLVGLTAFLGIALTVVLGIVLLLIVKIMLVGRLIGVARLTSAFIWTCILAVLLFPWQAFWENYDFKIPGALYTWDELGARVKEQSERNDRTVLFWARFVAFPVLAVIILLVIQIKSRRGLQQALGEATYESSTTPIA